MRTATKRHEKLKGSDVNLHAPIGARKSGDEGSEIFVPFRGHHSARIFDFLTISRFEPALALVVDVPDK